MLSVKPWRPDAVVLFVLAQAMCILLGGIAIGLLQRAGVHGFKSLDDFGYLLVATISFQGATWILMIIFFRMHGMRLLEGLGLERGNLLRSLKLAAGLTVVVLVVALSLQSVTLKLMEKMHWTPKDEEAVDLLTNANGLPAQIYLVIFTLVLVPVAEEFIFRGVLYPFIKQRGFPKTALIGVSLLFALIHGDAAIFVPLFVLALALTWLYEVTDNLLAPIFAHALFNAANLVLLKLLPS